MTDQRSEREKMLAGDPFLVPDRELDAMVSAARVRQKAFNDTPRTDYPARMAALEALIGKSAPKAWIESPFLVDYGVHIELGDCYINMNCTFLDANRIVLGDKVDVGPNVQLLTATHPVDSAKRHLDWPSDPDIPFRVASQALPITIENGVWLGAGVIVLPGVTIGEGTMVGAGSVVTKSLPPYVLAAGNPARVIRQLDRTAPSSARRP
ncbi:MAG TPA: sugar O-acetyltransferase [Bauldia sp.]|nr:sugar O-acetyltransferase [Bauldia sp.]